MNWAPDAAGASQGGPSSPRGLAPLQTLFDAARGSALPLPDDLRELYGGPLTFPARPDRPRALANFVSTLDGVVSLNEPGARSGGGEISGFNDHDRMVMGLLRAAADAVVIGAGTLRADAGHLWTASAIYPPLAEAYAALRANLGKTAEPLTVIVTASGALDLALPVFQSRATSVLVVTTPAGARRLGPPSALPASISVAAVATGERISASDTLAEIAARGPSERILVEGGPRLLGDFLAEGALDELFLTLAPQLAGRVEGDPRLGLIEGRHFAPASPLWSELLSVKRAGSHLLLRYGFEREA